MLGPISNPRFLAAKYIKPTVGLWLVMALSVHAQTKALSFQTTDKQVALVELYTSEGCSSCPPAEDWLSHLKDDAGLWKNFVPVAFHVDYWDDLGWKDPWESRQYTERQQAYAQSWKSTSVYTPEFVLSGKDWRNWSGSKTVPATTNKVGILMATSTDGNHWQVQFTPTAPRAGYEVHAALLSSALTSEVKAGENAGRKLGHDFVVTSLGNATLSKASDGFRGELVLTANPKVPAGRLAVAVWVTGVGALEPLQATGGWLVLK